MTQHIQMWYKTGQAKPMQSRLYTFSFIILLLLGLVTGCSKSKKNDQGNNNTDGVTLKKTSDPDKNTLSFAQGTPTCQKFFYLVHLASKVHLNKSTVDPMFRLAATTKVFTKNVLNKNYELGVAEISEEKIKDNDCSVFENLAKETIKNDRIAKTFGEKLEEFDAEEYVFENILDIYTNSLDMFSHFDGSRYSENNYGPSLPSGMRVLDRADYHDLYDSSWKLIKTGRKPSYLYVEYSPLYLSNIVPKYSRIYRINDSEVKDVPYAKSLENLSRSKKGTLSISTWDSVNKKYNPIKTVEVEYKGEIAREINLEVISEKPRIGYLHINAFSKKNLDSDLFKSLIDYLKSAAGKLDGTIIDLRKNPGGSLYETDKILGTILPDPETVTARRLILQKNGEFKPITDTTYETFPINFGKIVILTDFKTASASEMLVAALRDYSAAITIGETTIGKGIGQQGYTAEEEHLSGELTVTSFYIFSPSGRTWYLDGLQPDIEVMEKSNDGFRYHLSDKKNILPPTYEHKITINNFDPGIYNVQNRITQPTLDKLKGFRNDATQEPEECKKDPSELAEEQSCIRAWGFKILQKWIEIEPTPAS